MNEKQKILIVDDSQVVRLYMRNILEGAGYPVDEAGNGVEGLERIVSSSYALILVDINMAKMDGYEFVRTLRGRPHHVEVPVAMISSERADSDRRHAYEAGANLYLVKPIKPDALLKLVRFATGSHR